VSAALKQRAYRRRCRAGRAVFQIELDQVAAESMLIEIGMLSAADADDRDRVEAALQKFVEVAIAEHARSSV
jgi:hypothetical protein